ncbi:MAG TPA: GNAT family N-acetyltransferase [Steroidobacteraceae bacterium]|nr:GNAT family N-acetyltransferase [Steroidobacteraceae bacterium]
MPIPSFRPIRAEDDAAVAAIIRAVMTEFSADGQGFAIHDAEVDGITAAYAIPRAAYFVVELDGRVMGGAGVAPLAGGDPGVCELRKMYFLEEIRGMRMGERLLRYCIDTARNFGYATCYLETLSGMDIAQHLYQKLGFRRLPGPLGRTGHTSCNRFYALELL